MTAISQPKHPNESRVSYPAAFAILTQALDAETRRGFDDGAVKGGLDRLLTRLRDEHRLPPGSALARAAADLLQTGYATLTRDGREHWIGTLATLLARERSRLDQSLATLRGKATFGSVKTTVSAPKPKAKREPPRRTGVLTSLDEEVAALNGANRSLLPKLQSLGIETVRDLLYHFPHRYDDYSQVRPIANLIPGEQQTVVANVWSSSEKRLGRRSRATELIVGDSTGTIRAIFFNQPYLTKQFHTGATIVLSGRVSIFQHQRQLESPEWEILDKAELERAVHTGRLVPVYPLTAGLSARALRRLTREAIDRGAHLIEECLPPSLRQRLQLMALAEAIPEIHYPDSGSSAEAARRRLAFDELLALQLAVLGERRKRIDSGDATPIALDPEGRSGFLASLPFPLTSAQLRACAEIEAELASNRPMARLLQGDVGSGKTVVAAMALLAAVRSGMQALLMAPTEVLAEQHFRTICRLLSASPDLSGPGYRSEASYLQTPLRIGLLHGGMPARAKAATQNALAAGEIEIAIGTQALIQDGISVPRLGLAVVDEQHRFGVAQRAALRDKGIHAHLLVMTATPIPRTLALTIYGDLEISVIDEMPPGRQAIHTRLVNASEREHAYRFAREQIDAGRQVFVICPLVEESDKIDSRAAIEEYQRLSGLEVFTGVEIALLHGRMNSKQKEQTMRSFLDGESQILVSTAVVEVGIDVPNATVILIDGADRFGLAQLHQFRGRVGRGEAQSYCLLLSDNASPEASERLRLMEQTQDGFKLAEADLRLRGPGEYFGTRQSGLPELRVARLTDDALLSDTRQEASLILDNAPALQGSDWDLLRRLVERMRHGGGEIS
jgi:ATP-dependent DNA helicase RecG